VKLSIIIPTISRPALAATLQSIAAQPLLRGDEILVVGDGPQPAAEAMFRASKLPGRYIDGPLAHTWGGAQRQFALPLAQGDLIAFMDDDDQYLPSACTYMRHLSDPAAVNLFRMYHSYGRVLWARRRLQVANVSTQMAVIPNVPAKLGQWTARYEGDFDFISDTAARFGAVRWHLPILSRWRA
jgi:glycosyltransferase involved in cell wall biosynthesis